MAKQSNPNPEHFHVYRGFGIARLEGGDSFFPWTVGRDGDIFATAHTRVEAHQRVDQLVANDAANAQNRLARLCR